MKQIHPDIKIITYKTNIGNFFKVVSKHYYNSSASLSGSFKSLGGVSAEDIQQIADKWYLTTSDVDFGVVTEKGKTVLSKYELIDKRLSGTFLNEIPSEEVEKFWDEDVETSVWTGKHANLQGYYTAVYTQTEDSEVEYSFDVEVIRELQIDSYEKPAEMKVVLQQGNYGGKPTEVNLASIVHLEDFEAFLTPEFMQHTRPCKLSSQQVYKIIRAHVLSNIDNKYARVDANYEFCFSVNKVVATNPSSFKTEKFTPRGNSYRPPRFETQTVSTKNVKIFQMTHDQADGSGRGYKGYTIVEGWQAESLEAMYDQIQTYLADLMKEINSPTQECQTCKGCGMIAKEIATNERITQ